MGLTIHSLSSRNCPDSQLEENNALLSASLEEVIRFRNLKALKKQGKMAMSMYGNINGHQMDTVI